MARSALTNLPADIWTVLLDFVEPFTVHQLVSLVGNSALGIAIGRSCRKLTIHEPFYVKTRLIPIDFICTLKYLTSLHIRTTNYALFRTYRFATSLPPTITDLEVIMPYAHAMWVVFVEDTKPSTVSRPVWFEGPSVVRMNKLLPHLKRLHLQEDATMLGNRQQFPLSLTKFLQTLPKSVTSLSLNHQCLDFLSDLPKGLLELHITNESQFCLSEALVSAQFESHSIFRCLHLQTLVVRSNIWLEAVNILPRTLTDLRIAPVTPGMFRLHESSNVDWPPHLTCLHIFTRLGDWNTLVFLPRNVTDLLVHFGAGRFTPDWTRPINDVFPPRLTNLTILCESPTFLPPIPLTVTTLDLQYRAGTIDPKHLGNASSITIHRYDQDVPEQIATDGSLKHLSWIAASATPPTTFDSFPKHLVSLFIHFVEEKSLPVIRSALPLLKYFDLSVIKMDGASLNRDETVLSEATLSQAILSYIGMLLPKTKRIAISQRTSVNPLDTCLLDLQVDVFSISTPAGTPNYWRFPRTIRQIDLPEMTVHDINMFTPHFPALESISACSIFASKIPLQVHTLRVLDGPGVILNLLDASEYQYQHLSFPDATIYNKVPVLEAPKVKLQTLQLGDINLSLVKRHPLVKLELTQFEQWHNINLIPRTVTELRLTHPPGAFMLAPDDLRHLPPSLTVFGLPYMPATGWSHLPHSLTELELEWAASEDSRWFSLLNTPCFTSSQCEDFLRSLTALYPFKISNPRHKHGWVAAALENDQIAENQTFSIMHLNDHSLTPECFKELPRGLLELSFGSTSVLIFDILTDTQMTMLPPFLTRLDIPVYRIATSALLHLPPGLLHLNVRLAGGSETIVFPPSLLSLKVASPASMTVSKPTFPHGLRSLHWSQAIGHRWYREELPMSIERLLPPSLESLYLCGESTMFHPLNALFPAIKHVALLNMDDARLNFDLQKARTASK